MMKPFDTDRTPWLFTPHDDGELDEFFSSDHRYRYTLLRFADMIVRADVTAKKLKNRIIELDVENRKLRKQLADMERKMKQ